MKIRLLPEGTINRIAAGEVVERPASVVKELVENAIDAQARNIEVTIRSGGRSSIIVNDDGIGMSRDDLLLSVERHATSKLLDDDLFHISTLGFRGEALPSIASVSRLKIESRARGANETWSIGVIGGKKETIRPASLTNGTRMEITDLFFATPARLKFLKTDRTEVNHILDIVRRLAMANPMVKFSVSDEKRKRLRFDNVQGDMTDVRLSRLSEVMGRDFAENALKIESARKEIRLTGYAGLPTLNKAYARSQYLFVNGRPVRDSLLIGAVRGAYQDLLARNRHPMVALYLEIPPLFVDVNVHPMKTEVRFRDSGLVRGLIVGALKHALADAGHRTSTTVANQTLGAFRAEEQLGAEVPSHRSSSHGRLVQGAANYYSPTLGIDGLSAPPAESYLNSSSESVEKIVSGSFPLGVARAQLHETYIVAQTNDGIVIVDQHAAHERLVYEKMKQSLENGQVARQGLLIPEVIELEEYQCQRLVERIEEFGDLGLVLEAFGHGAVVVREVPAILGNVDIVGLVKDLADDLAELGEGLTLKECLEGVCGTMACHGSVRSGRRLNQAEMDAILRQMEDTPHSGQCNHGRPTYVELNLTDIERLFGRR